MIEPRSGNLLLNEPPLVVSPTLAAIIGLSEAIVLQQLHYWLVNAQRNNFGAIYEGRRWIYNTYETWREQFPFWSVPTIKRTINALEDRGLIRSTVLNRAKMDRTKWYTIDYDVLERAITSHRTDQSDPFERIEMI